MKTETKTIYVALGVDGKPEGAAFIAAVLSMVVQDIDGVSPSVAGVVRDSIRSFV